MTGNSLGTVDPALDAALEQLQSSRRRCILYDLVASEADAVPFTTVVDRVLACDSTATDEERLAVQLHHAELPKLEEAGWLEYDARNGTVRYRPRAVPTELVTTIRRLESDP